jgi:hypothetical protein
MGSKSAMHIAIVVHRHGSFGEASYWLGPISECWRESGIRVSVINDPRAHIEAELAILHVDLTVIPREYLSSVRRYSATINGSVSDISKRAISSHLAYRGDSYEGPVIVKTDRNDRGRQERRLARKGLSSPVRRDVLRNYLDHLKEEYRLARRAWRYGSTKAFREYPIFDSINGVPDAVWRDPELVVERFLPERHNDRYCVRTWLFLGHRERHAIFYSYEPVIKSHNIIEYERLSEVPEALRRIRKDLKFDFGKFDYTMVNEQPVLFDANRTPTIGDFPKERYFPIAQSLANGIDSFL